MTETKKCDHCGKEINVRFKICPFCSGEVRDPVEKELPPVCPRCGVSLETQTHGGEAYLFCPRCSGLWVDRETFSQATKESAVYKEEDVHKRYFRGPVSDPLKYIPCVRCGKLMNRKNFARISGVIIDECGSHGVWLDAGEMEKIRLFIVDGGLEKAQDKRIEKTAMELRDLAKKVDQTAFMQKLLHFWKIKRWLFGD
ncbi:MAG: hypothetical protein A2W09_03700 [Deltaproteobacteria bacterium RBG_16_50_11]|nr:MAG: hypothetical protein A2W09_03700 [Deltaproteobacteria bacterium RBG_16_50_11]